MVIVILYYTISVPYIEWASAQVPPTPLYLGGTVDGEREREREFVGEGVWNFVLESLEPLRAGKREL